MHEGGMVMNAVAKLQQSFERHGVRVSRFLARRIYETGLVIAQEYEPDRFDHDVLDDAISMAGNVEVAIALVAFLKGADVVKLIRSFAVVDRVNRRLIDKCIGAFSDLGLEFFYGSSYIDRARQEALSLVRRFIEKGGSLDSEAIESIFAYLSYNYSIPVAVQVLKSPEFNVEMNQIVSAVRTYYGDAYAVA